MRHREWDLRAEGRCSWIITYISVCDSFSDRFSLCSTENVFSFCLVWQCFVPRCIMGRLGVVLISWAGGEIMRRGQAVKQMIIVSTVSLIVFPRRLGRTPSYELISRRTNHRTASSRDGNISLFSSAIQTDAKTWFFVILVLLSPS